MADKMVFVVSDDLAVRDSVSELIASAGLQAQTFPSLEMWLAAALPPPQGCLLLDARIWDIADPVRLAMLTATCTRLPVLLLVDRGDVPNAVRAIKEGAADVLEKPLRDGYLLERIKTALAASQHGNANRQSLSGPGP